MKSVFDWKKKAGSYTSEWRHQKNRHGDVYHPIVFQVITPNLPLPLTAVLLSLLNTERFKLCPWCWNEIHFFFYPPPLALLSSSHHTHTNPYARPSGLNNLHLVLNSAQVQSPLLEIPLCGNIGGLGTLFLFFSQSRLSRLIHRVCPHFHTVCTRPVFPDMFFFFKQYSAHYWTAGSLHLQRMKVSLVRRRWDLGKTLWMQTADDRCDTGWKKVWDGAFRCLRRIKSLRDGAPAREYSIGVL